MHPRYDRRAHTFMAAAAPWWTAPSRRTRVAMSSGVGLVAISRPAALQLHRLWPSVVTAERLEAVNTAFDTAIPFSVDTYARAKVVDDVRPAGETRLKGVAHGVAAYTFMDDGRRGMILGPERRSRPAKGVGLHYMPDHPDTDLPCCSS